MTRKQNWDTEEVKLWLSNNGILYHTALRLGGLGGGQFKKKMQPLLLLGGCIGVDYSNVDWGYIVAQFK